MDKKEESYLEYLKIYINLSSFKGKGIGEKTISCLKKIKIDRVFELLYYFPRTYEDKTNIKKINELKDGEYSVVKARVLKSGIMVSKMGKKIFKMTVSDETGLMDIYFFKMLYLKDRLRQGDYVVFTGTVKNEFGIKMVNPQFKMSTEDKNINLKIEPVYSLIEGLNINLLRKAVYKILTENKSNTYEIIPEEIIKKYNLPERYEALRAIHFPQSIKEAERAKKRFAFEEIFMLELGILSKRFELDMQNREKYELNDNKEIVRSYLKMLNFELTRAQKKVITEIYKDLNAGKIVNRLIQGDVGSGKTVVVMIMLLYMIENGYQGVLMAPTEILAEQHYIGIMDELNFLGLRVEILTGSVKGKKKEKILKEIEEGLVNLVIGTHSLIEDNVKFKKLGLIVIDEQHKFGVKQRNSLRDKGILANLLVMSATPIPRSMALSIYGDLDVSIIDELPPGRKPIKTKWIKNEEELGKVYNFTEKKIIEGRQCYIVCPLIEDSEKLEINSAVSLYEKIKNEIFPDIKTALLHGRVKNEEKEEIMRDFKKGNIKILVATTVIEVGVNVPNACIMIIMDAHRFGLAQLHQLRGRIGRGSEESYCFLISSTENDVSQKRLEIMEKTNDGFEIAEEDLKLRKPGEIFGTKQSGMSDIRFVDVIRDIKLIKTARDEAIEYLKSTKGKILNSYLRKDIDEKFKEY